MLTARSIEQLAADLAAANQLPLDLARQYASLIGDTPKVDEEGHLVVRDENEVEIARLIGQELLE